MLQLNSILKRTSNDTQFWRCRHLRPHCGARFRIKDDTIILKEGEHNHADDSEKIKYMTFSEDMEQQAVERITTPVKRLYDEAVGKHALSLKAAAAIPRFSSLSKKMYRSRHSTMPALPHSVDDINLPEEWQRTTGGNKFLLIDNGQGSERFLVQKLGLVHQYKHDPQTTRWVRRLVALPLVPPKEMGNAWIWLEHDAPPGNATHRMNQYIIKTYLDDSDAAFHMSIWNHYESGNERTNNNLEGWHSKINKRASSRLNIFAMITLLRSIQAETEGQIMMLNVGRGVENYLDHVSHLCPQVGNKP
ncbi:uncharacterized protein [Parasteatoda tepidariorum]|uniref:uncharacterized protein n=1 Tax=Parasteatoda tepidariorum TaxID=114398 RepID=UPI001C7281F2|nr:uncharacterized protein LOC122272962 [Parasteatoda tepidariorum]